MISHELKTIFIHIPRTGGTSVETSLVGNNWWKIEPKTKHIDWQQAKQIYAEHWDSYLKFTIIRNPWDWLASLYHSHNRGGTSGWEAYIHNPRLFPHEQSSMLQSEIIGKEIDHILRYETLNEDFIRLCNTLGISKSLPTVQIGESNHQHYSELYSEDLRLLVAKSFQIDITRFGYKYIDSQTARNQDHKRMIFELKEQVALLEHKLKVNQQKNRNSIFNYFRR